MRKTKTSCDTKDRAFRNNCFDVSDLRKADNVKVLHLNIKFADLNR